MEENNVVKKIGCPIIVVIILLIVTLAGGIFAGYRIGKKNGEVDVTVHDKEEEKKEEVVSVDKDKMDSELDKFYWFFILYYDDYGVTLEGGENNPGINYFGNLKNGDEVLNNDTKKVLFALWYSYNYRKDIGLTGDDACEALKNGETECFWAFHAISVDNFKSLYKELYGEEFKDLNNFSSKSHPVKLENDYILFSNYSGTLEWMETSELHFNSLTRVDNEYTLTIDVYYRHGDYSSGNISFDKSNDQIIIKSIKNGDTYTLKSMTFKK